MNPGAVVLSKTGAAVPGDFANATGAPIVGDTDTGQLYWISVDGLPVPISGVVNAKSLGAIGDGVTDDTQALNDFQDSLNTNPDYLHILPGGTYLMSERFEVLANGAKLDFYGGATLSFTGTDYFRVSSMDGMISPATSARLLTANMLAGANSCAVASVTSYTVDMWVVIMSGTSVNSTLPNNYIPLYKQEFQISAINSGTKTLTFYQRAEAAFNTADSAYVTEPSVRFAVGAVINNPRIIKGAGVPYECGLGGINVTVNNLDCPHTGVMFCAAAFNLIINYAKLCGSTSASLSVARGCGRVIFNEPHVISTSISGTNGVAFIEESPNEVIINEPYFYGGEITATSSSDSATNKILKIRGGRIVNPYGRALTILGFYNVNDYAVSMIGTDCQALGRTNGTEITVVQANFFNSVELLDCNFSDYDVSASTLLFNGGNSGAVRLNVGNLTFDSTPLAISATYLPFLTKRYSGPGTFWAGTTAGASINLPHGVAPTAPVDGDLWTTTTGLFVRVNGITVGPLS